MVTALNIALTMHKTWASILRPLHTADEKWAPRCLMQLCVGWSLLYCAIVPQELNNRLAAEITRLRTLLTGDGGGESTGLPLTQGKDAYELEVL